MINKKHTYVTTYQNILKIKILSNAEIWSYKGNILNFQLGVLET